MTLQCFYTLLTSTSYIIFYLSFFCVYFSPSPLGLADVISFSPGLPEACATVLLGVEDWRAYHSSDGVLFQ